MGECLVRPEHVVHPDDSELALKRLMKEISDGEDPVYEIAKRVHARMKGPTSGDDISENASSRVASRLYRHGNSGNVRRMVWVLAGYYDGDRKKP